MGTPSVDLEAPTRRLRFLFVAVLVLALTVGARSAGAAIIVTVDGAGGMRPGMDVAAVESLLGVALRIDRLYTGNPCGTATFRTPGVEGYALFFGSRLASLWFEQGVRTGRGIRIGSTVAALRRAYPNLRSRPDAYTPGARNLFFRRPEAPHWRLRFDVSQGRRVTRIAFGNDTVFLTEGCA